MHCPNVNSPEWKSLVERVGEVNAWREFFKYGAIPSEKQAQVLQSIRTKTTEEIADILGNDLVRSDENIKYTNFIQALVLNKMGDLTPGKKMEVSPEKAFSEAKKNFETAVSKIQDFLSIVKDEAMFNGLKERDAAKLATQLESRGLTGVTKYGDVLKALSRFKYVVDNFDELKENVKFSLAHKGIQIRKNKLEAVDPVDVTNQQEDETEDNAGIPNEEINPQKFDASVFETNFRNTASLKVRGLIQTIRTGEHELGIPLYANPEDVMSDILYAGAAMKLSGYTDKMGKYKAFITALELRSQARPYLSDLIWKIDGGEGPNKNVKSFKNKGEWHTINQILTFATKAFANENILLYQLRRQGTKIVRVSNVKTIGTNQETVDALISKYWLAQHKDSSFFTKTVTGELYPVPEKVNELDRIRKEGKALSGEKQVAKFIEYFKVLGIELTKEDMDYITPNLSKKIKRGSSFSLVFADNQMLDNIYKSFESMQKTAFKDDYGFQNEKKSMKALAGLYYDANPGRFDVVSARTADGKSKYLYIQPSYAEILKREWNNASDDTGVSNTALARPNRDFWKQVKLGNYKFNLGYFNGSREQQAGKDGKVRKNFTQKEQQVAMFLKHQENLNVGSYILFTLSDKTTTIETKMTKEFFVDNKNQPMGKGLYFNIGEDGKTLEYTDFLKKKLYNSFVEPEVSRILSAMKAQNVNLENFDTASKLFYIIPAINSDGRLNQFREDLYKGEKSIERLNAEYGSLIGDVVLQEFLRSSEDSLEDLKNNGIIEVTEQGDYAYPLFKSGGPTDYLNRVRFVFNNTKVDQKSRALLMLMDMKLNYMNAQVKSIQFLKFDPMVAYKKAKDVSKKAFNQYSGEEKIKLANSTWDEFSKRAAALIAPGSQGSWSWISKGKEYDSTTYKAVTVADVNDVVVGEFKDFDTTDAQEFVTLQEHIDYLMSEGKISIDTWNSIHEKIVNAGKGGYYTLTDEEVNEIFNPVKPVHVGNAKEGAPEDGLYRVDYIKTSRYPLLPQHEKGSERDKLRIWMENNDIQAVNFASGKKLGRPELSVSLFDKNGNFVEPSVEDLDKASQVLSRDGLRNQQEIPHQKDEIATVSQMNRTLFDQLLDSTFTFSNMKDVTGREGKALKEAVRSRMFEQKAEELRKKIGDLTTSHRGLYNLLRETILNDTTGSYTKNDLDAIQLDKNGFFKMSLETHFKAKKMQGLINSMVNKNVMLKVEGTSFIQVSGVGAKFNYSSLSKGAKSDIIWTDTYAKKFKKDGEAKLEYIRKNDKGEIQPAQVLVSQYLRDSKGNLINLNDYITEKDGVKILDTSKFTPEMFQLVASRIPNQSHVSMLPIEVVGFLPSYMENSIVVPDGITAQMGSDFDVDKLFAYTSTIREQEGKDGVKTYRPVEYSVSSINDVDGLSKEQLTQLYRDIHWNVLTHPDTFGKITKSVDNPEVKKKVEVRNALLDKYGIVIDKGANLPLDFNTSIQRFVDNKSGKNGVSIFANLISAQADLQDKPLRLGKMVDKQPVTDPVQIRLSKSSKRIIDLVNVGETGTSTSFLNKKRSISDNLNIMFTESVDNAKNQFLKEFGWTEKSMGAVGLLSMLTDDNGQAVPIEFSMDLTSQPAIQKMLEKIDQKQDSFGKFDSDAILNSIVEIQSDIEKYLDKHKLTPTGLKAAEYLSPQNEKRDSILDPETLSEMWVVGKALDETDVEKRDATLEKLAKDFGYKSKDALMLKYFEVQYDSLNLFNRLQDLGRELMTILGSVYTYTKGIGPNVFATKQKMEQLNKLSNSFNFLGIENLAGLIEKKGNQLEITPQGEIGYSIKNSLIFAQNLYNNIFPISVGSTLESLVEKILDNRGLNKKDLSKNRYESTYSDVFNGVKNYLFTMPDLGLFTNVRETRNTLINGDTSIGKRVIDLLKQPEFSKNGFLKNIDIDVQPNGVYVISFRAPFGTEIDESLVMSGFYQLATSKKEEIRQLAKDFALYPFATGDAGSIGRFIPVNYYLSDKDFRDSIKDIDKAFVRTMSSAGKLNEVVDQIVQNNSEEYAQKFSFGSTVSSSATYETPFKQVIKPLLKGAENLASVKKLKFTIGDFEAMDNTKGLVNALKVPLTEAEINFIQKNVDPTFDPYEVSAEEGKPGSVKSKYPSYILITDSLSVNLEEGKSEEDRNVNYLYKRVSSIIDPVAEYERINILGYKNIKEYSFDNPNLKSVIKGNDVDAEDSIFLPDPEDQVVEKEIPTSKNDIYSQLGNKTKSENVVIKPWAELKDASEAITPEGIIATRIKNSEEHFGNPYSHDPAGKAQGLIKTETIKEAVEKYIDWVINSFNLEKKNLFTVTPRQTVDKKAIIKASIATQYIGFGEGINNSSTELYRQQAGKYANTGNYSYKDTIFVSIGGKRGTEQQQKEQQDRTIKEVLKAIETGATIITDNKAYIDSSSYNTGEKRLYSNLEAKGYKYSEKTIDGQLLGVWNKEGNRAEWVREQLKSGILKGKPIVYYKELGEPSHATALDYLINKYDWGKEISTKETKKVEKVEISSNAKGLAGALTNPTELSKSKGNIAQSYPVEYKGTTYKDAEAAYQALKDTSEAKTKPGIAESNNYRLMVNIIEAKLTQHPRLVSEITKMGGVEWISDATHQPTSKNTVWETGGQNWFIKSLAEAYQNVLNKESQANVEDTTLAEVKHETLEYKGTDFIHEGNIEEGTLAFYYQNKESGKGALVTDPNLNNKLSVAYEVKTRPQDVVQLTELQHSPKYLVSFEGQVLSLNPSSYGDEIQSPDIIRRVLEKYNTKLEDKVVEEAKGAKPGEEKPTFSYKGITVNTEFQLSKEQETALTTLIDFVSNPADDSGPYGASFTLEGYAGTGKTSIIGVLEKYISQKQKHTDFVYMAPTHAATVSLGLNVVKYGSKDLPMTVQSATATDFRTGQIKFSKKFTDRVKGINAVVVLDEASMLANKDFDKIILAARSKGYKIIFMGDPKQIPEVDNAEAKAIAKAFSNPNITKLSQVFRTKDVNILTVLTNIRNNKDFKEQIFESTENLKQVSRSEYNNLLINDLQNDLENTTIINYTNNGVFKANLSARKVLNFSGELQVGEKIVGYLGSQTKQIEKGHLANSVPYIVKDINKSNKGPVQITCTSQLLKNLTALGMKGFPEGSSFTYLQLSKTADSLDFNLTPEQLFFNKQEITKYLRPIHELNLQYKNKQISYPAYTEKLYELRSKMSDINLGNKYIYNPTTDDVELYDRNKHKGINANLELDKGVDFGYAITIHKSQGMTIPNVYFDVNSLSGLSKISIMRDGELFNTEKNALYYVGMSRASNKLVVPLDVSNEVPDSDPFSPGMAQGEEYINLDDLLGANDNTSVTDKVVKETFGDKSAPVTAKEILNKVYATSSPLYRQLLKLVAETGGVGGLKFVVDETLENPGEYNVGSKIITINPKLAVGEDIREGDETLAKERLHEVIMHEVMHHVTAYMINADPSSLSLEQRKWVTALKGLFSSTKEKILKDPKHRDALLKAIQEVSADNASLSKKDKSMYYGLTNVHDFVSMLMTDEGFREFMNNTTFEGDKSIFDRFLDILANILKALGIEIKENSVLKEGIGDIVGLIKSREQSNREVSEDVFKSVKTSSKFEYVKDNLSNIVESLNIVKTC